MTDYSSKVKKRIEAMKLDTLHDVYIKAFIYLFILGSLAIVLRSEDLTRTIKELIVNILGGGSFVIFLHLIKAKVKGYNKRYWIYLAASLMYSIATAIITSDDFLTTGSIGLVVFAVLVFFSFSQLHLIVYIMSVAAIIAVYTVMGVGQQVNLTNAYPVSAVGSFLILGYILIRGAKLFREYEDLLYDQIKELDEKNMELAAYNEEFKATEEEIMSQYDEIRQLNTSLAHSNAQTKAIVNATEDAFIGYNPETNEFDFSSGVKTLLQLETITIEDKLPSFLNMMEDRYRNHVRSVWKGLLNGDWTSKIIEVKYPIGTGERDYQLTFLGYKEGAQSEQYVIAIKDITDRKENERLEKWKVYHDEMTGLLNRKGFSYDVDEMLDNDRRDFYVMLFDIDDFKYINTSFGYAVGDQIIAEVGNCLSQYKSNIRHLAHLDGDSFIMTVASEVDADMAIKKLEEDLGTISVDDIEFNITCGIGIGTIEGETSAARLIQSAEIAMYQAKANGKKQHARYSDVFITQVSRRYQIIQALENVVENKELYLLYQPKVASDSKRIIGYEALVRWESEDLGFVSPMEFIDLAEKTGQIIEIGYYIIKEAMTFTKTIAELDSDILVSINISAKQLVEEQFIEHVSSIIEETGVDIGNVGFEVTETAYIDNMEDAELTLKKLSKLGIKIYLDDFGTGYSSLAYLDRLPIDYLKIDKSFIDDIHRTDRSKHMLKAILSLSKSLGIECVAEGVELEAQFDILRQEACERVQGYYFDQPLQKAEALQKVGHNYK